MILIEGTEVFGLRHAIRGMRNPMNSWDRSDSYIPDCIHDCENCGETDCQNTPGLSGEFVVGSNDLKLMKSLSDGGPVHAKFRRMITVYADITAPLYWWKEFDTYKIGTVGNSCSTMHKIHEKEFTLDDFSHEHLMNYGTWNGEHGFLEDSASYAYAKIMGLVVTSLNGARDRYLDYNSRGSDYAERAKQVWWQMIQLLPSSYNQKRTIMLNYEVLANIIQTRNNHKLDEWRYFCNWIEELPYAEIIIGGN